MNKVASRDGTPIAYDRVGAGPAVILVDGALCYRGSGPSGPLAAALARHFAVITYDRRGRGESGDTLPYAIDREVEDLEALIGESGGSAFVYGISSGAALALEAANRLAGIKKLIVYEAPFVVDRTNTPLPAGFVDELTKLLDAGKRSAAVKLFMRRVGVPWVFVQLMALLPVWKKLTAMAHTLVYDMLLVRDYQRCQPLPAGRWGRGRTPTLVAVGGKSPAWMTNAMKALAEAIPGAELRVIAGQTHMLKPEVIAPVMVEFFGG